ncbi:hypothetical protein V9789_001782 [Vibrio vulnificus]|uniref:hypothetical protein n=1 Tax=Vibrio vulnificus TaxID=672 RepID=UPI000576C4C1|nr:hypothetical protein [Vibrio vulnificus]EGQ9275680.1 hypothetical protein [Vibrio vulnificus]EGQ9279806.1 hypothetical protein [Vibrio vulnificus]EGQ9299589.1 hypothetical protein [Vibrio vulnificus]EGQ9303846.1 hypothetical protein [Vibrio vulnificus]EHK9050034.1 hypothetical protein [Vibrio vulnificus]
MMGLLRRLLGFKSSDKAKKDFEIEVDMVSPDVFRMNMKSFRESKIVQQQIKAAKTLKEA